MGMGVSGSRVRTGPKKQKFKLRTCVRAVVPLVKVRAVRFVPRAKRGQSVLLTHIPLLTLIWPLVNTAKTLIMLKNQKAAKGKAANG